MDTDKSFCRILLDVMSLHGVSDVVCSPGSRNTPLLIAAEAREELKKHIVIDERSAAFMAVGMALVSKKPVALICTSGTALLNYAPAVAEAYYQGVPLIVLSADRPGQWIDQDDSQTLRQFEALSNFVKKSFEVPAYGEDNPELQWYVNRIANEAMIEAIEGKPGPVHINIPLAEPLSGKIPAQPVTQRLIRFISSDSLGNKEEYNGLARRLAESRVMLTAGFMTPDASLQKAVANFASLPNVVVMAETLSNLHLKGFACSIDSVLTQTDEKNLNELAPDIVVSIGGALVSRKLKEYLRRNSGRIQHWSLGPSNSLADCFQSMTLKIDCEPGRFLRNLFPRVRKYLPAPSSGYQKEWGSLRERANKRNNRFLETCPWSELKAFDYVLKSLPRNYNLFLSNGTPVRYAQIIDYELPHASYCNRGVSGIDGSVSTAVGGAKAYKGPSLLITGDLSMAYDVSALSLPEVPDDMKIIVIDNQGGGIFRFIPTTSSLDERDKYLCHAPALPLQNLAEGYGWGYFEAGNEDELKLQLTVFLKSEKKSILKIQSPPEKSAEILKNFLSM